MMDGGQIVLGVLEALNRVAPTLLDTFLGPDRTFDEALAEARSALPIKINTKEEDDGRRERLRNPSD